MPPPVTQYDPYMQEMRHKLISYCDEMPEAERTVLNNWLLTIQRVGKKIESIPLAPTKMTGSIPEHIDRLRQRQIVVIQDGEVFVSAFFAAMVHEFGLAMPTHKKEAR